MSAAAMSPSTRKIIAQLDTSGGETCVACRRRVDGVRGCGRVDGVDGAWRHPYAIAATLRHHGDGVAHRSRAQVEGKQVVIRAPDHTVIARVHPREK